jgi:mono/diheme cytochrome c family protein
LLVFKPGGIAKLPIVETDEQSLPSHELASVSPEQVENGRELYNQYCAVCHGGNAISGGIVPDLRYRIGDLDPAWQSIVIDGALAVNGMPAWQDYLSPDEADTIKGYVAYEAKLGQERGEHRLVRR